MSVLTGDVRISLQDIAASAIQDMNLIHLEETVSTSMNVQSTVCCVTEDSAEILQAATIAFAHQDINSVQSQRPVKMLMNASLGNSALTVNA